MDWLEECVDTCVVEEQREADVGLHLIEGELEHLVHDDAELLDCLDECGLVSWRPGPTTPKRRRIEAVTPPRTARGCHCRKSRCLKLYCDCYAAGTACTSECQCQECGNATSVRAPRALFEHCACTRTACRTKYCVCAAAGRACGHKCRCTGCENH